MIYYFQMDRSDSATLRFERVDSPVPLGKPDEMIPCPDGSPRWPIVFDDTNGVPRLVNGPLSWWKHVKGRTSEVGIVLPDTFVDEDGRIRDKDMNIIMDIDQPKEDKP